MKTEIKKIAIVRLSALGDIVNSSVVLQFINQFYPKAKIEWITEEIFEPILNKNPYINAIHTINIKKIKKQKSLVILLKTIKKLHSLNKYDIIIDMQGLIKSAIVSRLIGEKTHGFDKNSIRESLASLLYKTSSEIAYEESVVLRNCFVVADALDFEITKKMLLEKKAIFPDLQPYTLQKKNKNVAFVIGASWKSKIYPKELIVKICDNLEVQCHIIWGSSHEKETAEWIFSHTKNTIIAPKLRLDELVSYISAMDLVIGNDTGPTHMAWAQNIASITLFGPTNSRMIYETPKNLAIESLSEVNILKINKNDFSIKEIDYKKIVKTAKELLDDRV